MVSITDYEGKRGTDLVDLTTAGALLGRSRSSMYRHLNSGDVTPVRLGGAVRVRLADLRKLLGLEVTA